MHFNTFTTATTMVAILAQTSEANIGQGAGLLGRIFSEIGSGAWGVGVEVATKKAKRNIPYISKRVPQNTSPYPGVSDVEYNRCFDELTSTRVEVTSPASDGIVELYPNLGGFVANKSLSDPIRQRPGLLHEPRQRSRWRWFWWPLRPSLRLCLPPVHRSYY